MGNKRYLAYAVVAAILAALVYAQFRTWKDFDWATFWAQGKEISLSPYSAGHRADLLQLFPARAALENLPAPGASGNFRPRAYSPDADRIHRPGAAGTSGELIRPYLIARRTNLTFSSQMAVWAVERIFDVGAFTILLGLAIFLSGTELRPSPEPDIYRRRANLSVFCCLALVAALSFGAVLVAKFGEALSAGMERRVSRLGSNLGHRIAQTASRIPWWPRHHPRSGGVCPDCLRIAGDVVAA